MRYVVLMGNLPGEGLWCTAESYAALVTQIKEAFGDSYNPIFKYKLPCNPKMLSPPGGSCYIIIDDEDDFYIWKNGYPPVAHHRDALDDIHYPPTPLTKVLYVFRKDVQSMCVRAGEGGSVPLLHGAGATGGRVSPVVLHAEHDVVKMPLYSLLPPLILLKLGVRVTLRHSNAAEAILFSSRSVSGAGEGHWGLLVRKAQSAWGVARPCFRYLDLDNGLTAMNIFNLRDYMFWSHGVGRERTELVVLENVYCDNANRKLPCHAALLEAGGGGRFQTSEVRGTSYDSVARCEATEEDKDGRPYTVTTTATVRGVHCGLYGPPFTTEGLIPHKDLMEDAAERDSLEHHQKLVKALTRSGLF